MLKNSLQLRTQVDEKVELNVNDDEKLKVIKKNFQMAYFKINSVHNLHCGPQTAAADGATG